MARTSPCFYIAPTAISVSPNANGSASDIAVNVVRGAKIKVYSPGVPALGYSDVSFQQWTLTGRNRRLADNTKPYSIYARLAKSNKEDGYLVFAPKVASGTEWLDKYAYVTVGGLATGTANKNSEDYWYVKLGDVSLPTNNARTVTLDTGILGTDKFNTDWNIDPDQMPLRIELSATIDAKDAGDKPYVEWGKVLTLKANLLEGWANANVQRFHHFTIQRNTGNELSDKKYNYPDEKSDSENPSSGRQMPNGIITLSHARGTDDVFNGTVSSIWTVIAWGLKANVADNTSSSSGTSGTVTANVYEKLAEKSINIMAETGEQYALEMSSSVVNYDPSSETYNPKDGIDVMVRATDQRGKVFKLTNAQLGAANLFVQYSRLEHPEIWSNCDFNGAATAVAKANIPIKAFEAQKNVNVRIVKAHYLEIYRSHIAFIRKGEKGDKGDPGTPGNGIDHVETRFFAWKSDTFGTGFDSDRVWEDGSTTMPNDFSDDFPWLWQVTRTYYTNGTDVLGEAVCIGYKGKDGSNGKDAVTYGVQVSSYSEWISAGNKLQGLQFGFTKTTGTTVEKYTDVTKMGCTVKIYGDDTLYDNVSGWINEGNDNFLFSSFPYNNVVGNPTLADKSVISVELYHDDVLLATANYANGKGALEISVDPDTIVFDTNDDGIVPSGTSKRATIACYRDGKKVTNVEYDLMEGGHPDCSASISTSKSTATVTISNIAKDESYGVSKTCGTVEVQVYDKDNGRYYFPVVKFTVNVAKFNGGLAADNKSLKSQYSELTNDGDGGTITSLKEYRSEILQSAREISLKVSEKSVGRRNMLVGSACRKYGDGFTYMSSSETQYYDNYPLEQIEINSGIDGVNCIHCRTKRTGTDDYFLTGFSWKGFSPQGNIKLEKGKNYVLSFYAKTPTPNDIVFIAEVLYQGSKIDTSRPAKYDGPTGYSTTFSVSEANKWELFTVKVSVPSNAKYEYEEINIFARSKRDYFVDGYICKPMLEEGEEYNGWTLSEQDYDYVGGNLLDGTGTLTKTGNVEVLDETTVNPDGYNNESASVVAKLPPTTLIGDFLQYSTKDMGLKVGEDCVLSFYARAASDYAHGKLQCYLYSPSTGIVMTESSHEKLDSSYNPADGSLYTNITPTTAWKRYWVHWRPMGNVPQHVLFRLVRPGTYKESYDSSTSYNVGDVVLYGGTYYVCQKAGSGYEPGASSYWEATEFAIEIARPKLEVGATMTEWTEKRADMVDKQALYATGIDIDSKKITLTASNTTFRGNDGKELAVIDQDGLRATKIATTDNGGGHTEISGNTTVWYNKDGVTPGIKVFYDAAGVPHFQFCNSNGKVMYDFGPSGLQSFISSTQQAYSDECYLRDASSSVSTSGTKLSFDWLYVARNQSADKRFVWRKQIPTTEASSHYEIYDGCVFTKEYYNTANSVNWPKPAYLLPDGWYVEPNDGNLPMKIRPADDEGVLDPTQTVYYQTFYKYEGGKVSRTVRAYMKRTTSSQLVSKFTYAGSYDEI